MPAGSPSRLVPLAFPGPAGALEALLQEPGGAEPVATAVVCHPHPLYGGTLHNKVVHRVASTLHALGAAALRFNFRGVGASEGRHDAGEGEREDARAALEFMRRRWPAARRWLAGFSFGSWVAARVAAEEPGIDSLLLVAPPVATSSFEALRRAPVPKLVVQGKRDDVCPLERLLAEFPRWADPKRLVTVEGASHFFDRRLDGLADAVRELLAPATPAP